VTSTPVSPRDGLKLGLFMPSVSYNTSISRYKPDPSDWTFESNKRIALAAEDAGFDFLFPVSRWKGFGGEINFHGQSLETMTWASGLLAVTSTIEIFSTVHVPIFNPVVAAKMGATLDHISNGRWGINIISGWSTPEFEMMGIDLLDYDRRYERTEDFIKILKGLWTEEPGSFGFKSDHYTVRDGYVQPQPQRKPHPPIVNAGSSDVAKDMVARQCDWAFVAPMTLEQARDMAADFKARAATNNRTVRIVAMVLPIWSDDPAHAEAERQKILDQIDWECLKNMTSNLGNQVSFEKHTLEMMAYGTGSMPLIGTPRDVAEGLAALYKSGIDGVLMSYLDYYEDTLRFDREVLPILKELGVRG
jgi:dimethylsulfone monooxygenase